MMSKTDKLKVPNIIFEIISENREVLLDYIHEYIDRRINLELEGNDLEEAIDWLESGGVKDLLRETEQKPEKLYYVKLMDEKRGMNYLVRVSNGGFTLGEISDDLLSTNGIKATFTEQEIKEIDERYWQFAEPVEEWVVEQLKWWGEC